MKIVFLINIETDTMISLDPKGMILEVKQSFSHVHYLQKECFVFLYFLARSRPHAVRYTQIKELFEAVDSHCESRKNLDKAISQLKKQLKSYGVNDFIVKVKKVGYCVSNKWVTPSDNTKEASRKRWTSLVKLASIIAPNMKGD